MLHATSRKAGIEVLPLPSTGLSLPPFQVRSGTEPKIAGQLSLMQKFYLQSDKPNIFLIDGAYKGIDQQRLNSDFLQQKSVQSCQDFIKYEAAVPHYLQQVELQSKYQLPSIQIAQKAIGMCESARARGDMLLAFEWVKLAIAGSNGIPGLGADPVLNIYKAIFILERLVYDPTLVGEAITCLKKSLSKLDPKDANIPLVYNRLAIACSVSGDHKTAIEFSKKLLALTSAPEDRFNLLKTLARAGQRESVFQILSEGRDLNLIYQAVSDPDIGRCFAIASNAIDASAWLGAIRSTTLKSELGRFPELANPELVSTYESFFSRKGAVSKLTQMKNYIPSLFELPNFIDKIEAIRAEVVSTCEQFTETKKTWRGEIVNALEVAINIDQNHWLYQRSKTNLLQIIAAEYVGKRTVSELWGIFVDPETRRRATSDIVRDFKTHWSDRMQDAYASVSRVDDHNTMIGSNPEIQKAILEYRQATDATEFEGEPVWEVFQTQEVEILRASLASQGAIIELGEKSYLAPHVAQMFFERYKESGAPFFKQDGTLDRKFREPVASSLPYPREGGGNETHRGRLCPKWAKMRDLMEEQLQAITRATFCPPATTPFGVDFSDVISADRQFYLNYGAIVNRRLRDRILKPAIQYINELANKLESANEHQALYQTLLSDQSMSSKALCLLNFSSPSSPTRPVRDNFVTRVLFLRRDDQKYNSAKNKFEAHLARYQSVYEDIQAKTNFRQEGFIITPISIGIFLLAQGDPETMSLLG